MFLNKKIISINITEFRIYEYSGMPRGADYASIHGFSCRKGASALWRID